MCQETAASSKCSLQEDQTVSTRSLPDHSSAVCNNDLEHAFFCSDRPVPMGPCNASLSQSLLQRSEGGGSSASPAEPGRQSRTTHTSTLVGTFDGGMALAFMAASWPLSLQTSSVSPSPSSQQVTSAKWNWPKIPVVILTFGTRIDKY